MVDEPSQLQNNIGRRTGRTIWDAIEVDIHLNRTIYY